MIKTSVFLLSALICTGTCAASTDLSGFDLGSMGLTKRMEAAKQKAWHLARNPRGAASGGPALCTSGSTVGTLTLLANSPRLSGISPLTVFVNATGTTDSATLGGQNNTFQDVFYAANFGDGGSSGTGTWSFGSNPNGNSRNLASGPVTAHTYVVPDGSGDTSFTITLAGSDGTSAASCILHVTVFDPSGSNGFPGTATTCVAASTTPVAGSGGCPSGAGVLQQSVYDTALNSKGGSNKRVLLKCGDTFTSTNYYHITTSSKESIGAYGGCQGTQTSRPIFSNTTDSIHSQIQTDLSSGDIRVSDIDFEGTVNPTAGGPNGAVGTDSSPLTGAAYQVTLYNLKSHGNKGGYASQQGAQWAIVGSTQDLTNDTYITTFLNSQGAFNFPLTTGPILNEDYLAIIGSSFDGPGTGAGAGAGFETVRIPYSRFAFISNSTFLDGSLQGAVLKVHGFNNCQGCTFTGNYTEYDVISDNLFGGTTGQAVETATTGGLYDERLRYFIVERNFWHTAGSGTGNTLFYIDAQNESIRDNVFYMPTSGSNYPLYAMWAYNQDSSITWAPAALEIYNNTGYSPTAQTSQTLVNLVPKSGATGATSSIAKNNLFYSPSNGSAVTVAANGNTASNNTATPTVNPSFTNGGGSFGLITDFKPTANFLGGTSVPVQTDMFGTPWSPTWDFGAIHH